MHKQMNQILRKSIYIRMMDLTCKQEHQDFSVETSVAKELVLVILQL